MSTLPDRVLAILDEVGGNNCSGPSNELELDSTADPPEYNKVSGGDFLVGKCVAIKDGDDIVDWQLTIRYMSAGSSCNGLHVFRKTTAPPSDPRGTYCKKTSSGTDCTAAEATITDCV